MNLKLVARVVTFNPTERKILLVRNKGANFWYPPGGGWEYDRENILECAIREVREETGLSVEIEKFLYVQEFHESSTSIFFETFWLARLVGDQSLNASHIDLDPDGAVEEVRWFSQAELAELKVFPKRLKGMFWDSVDEIKSKEDPFIGIS